MNFKRFLGAAIAAFIFVFIFDWIVHGILLVDWYHETPQVWRQAQDMAANMSLAMLIQLVLIAWITFAFTQFYPEGGIRNGLFYGLFIGVFAGILMSEWYLWLPVASNLAWSWLTSGIAKGVGIGLVLGAIYRR